MTGPNACGGCNLCCTVMRVEMEPVKEPWQRCAFACKGGCAIYADRPEPCRTWSCVWLHSQTMGGDRLPSALRPDRCGVVVNVNSVGTILAHCATPAAWQADRVRRWLFDRARSGKSKVIVIAAPGEVILLNADGSTEELRDTGFVDPATNERRYARVTQK